MTLIQIRKLPQTALTAVWTLGREDRSVIGHMTVPFSERSRSPAGASNAIFGSVDIVDQEQDRDVHELWRGQGRVRRVCHADRGIAALAPSVEAASQRTDPFDATSSED